MKNFCHRTDNVFPLSWIIGEFTLIEKLTTQNICHIKLCKTETTHAEPLIIKNIYSMSHKYNYYNNLIENINEKKNKINSRFPEILGIIIFIPRNCKTI